ncbi:MAG: metallophosphoesterase family protein [Nanoarchaeota archaeon]|nr:metallophosphoesterase family protein [Nanoarchaeota archaeon]
MTLVAILSDVHAHLDNFLKALAGIKKQGITEIISLGDIIGYGDHPEKCVKMAMDLEQDGIMRNVLGNHGAVVSGKYPDLYWEFNPWAQSTVDQAKRLLSVEQKEFLKNLPIQIVEDGTVYVHGCPIGEKELLPHEERAALLTYSTKRYNIVAAMVGIESLGVDIGFFGHYHLTEAFKLKKNNIIPTNFEQIETFPAQPLVLDLEYFYGVDVGSIGKPRDLKPGYVVFDKEKKIVTSCKLN